MVLPILILLMYTEASFSVSMICSIGSYYCVLEHKGGSNPSLVDELRPHDQSVINGLARDPSGFGLAVEDRSWLGFLPCQDGRVVV
ncbi:hypothetical protein MLD38_029446 [Melastoma candidum]|uniref:Uncharacterized protein n=1 Tax=Melastoma candidum TaxID=119954 RepID=A0ACB9N3S0_9MYRT|nr:hypothetical protein MLD38_029446 [Melastoma candidum]